AMIDHLQRFIIADDVTLTLTDRAVLGVYGNADLRFELPDRTLPVPGVLVLDDRLEKLLAEGAVPMGFEAWERLRINHGYPRWGVDMGPDLLPMEAGLERIAIRYDKGCYIGQEVIQRVKTYSEPPRMLVRLELDGPASPGTPVLADGQEVGHVTSARGTVALALVRKEHKAPGTRLAAGGATAVVRPLPWSTPPP
ncbi:MAG TPA: glycine cleavage T C-terminal barrel domain-containing protein, partial [Planctomycetota bacterium]|nr:glycine cleavage T C-terminal barrel domain-containing protein [Planctomycetota bacterium]